MSAHRSMGSGFGSMGKYFLALALLATAGPAAAQWTHSGTATVGSRLGVGTTAPERAVHLQSKNAVFRMDRDKDSSAFMLVRTALNDFDTILKTWVVGATASGANTGTFFVADFGTQDGGTGIDRLRIDNLGDLWAAGSNLQLQVTTTSPNGYAFISDHSSTMLANTSEGLGEEAFLALNGDTVAIGCPGGQGLLRIMDTDNYWTNFLFWNDAILMQHMGDITINADHQGDNQELILSTTGQEIVFISDRNDDTIQQDAFSWYANGTTLANKHMGLEALSGILRTKGAMIANHAFDLAEAYWKSEDSIAAGDVVCIDPERPNAVVLARAANDPSVVGVVSTDPGIIMGGGAFSIDQLKELWGEDVANRFAAKQPAIRKKLASSDPYIKASIANRARIKSALAKTRKAAEKAAVDKEYQEAEIELENSLEEAAIKAFCQENLALLALAGRVPVKVDASYGAIQVGNLLVASATPGRAMRADSPTPGTVIGKALEPLAAGQGMIMMQVLNR